MRDMWSRELQKDEPNLDVKFQYALTLIKTGSTDKNREGLSLLQGKCEGAAVVGSCSLPICSLGCAMGGGRLETLLSCGVLVSSQISRNCVVVNV